MWVLKRTYIELSPFDLYEVKEYNRMYFKHIISIIFFQTLKTLSKYLPAKKVLQLPDMCFNDSRYTSKKSKAIHKLIISFQEVSQISVTATSFLSTKN